MGSPTAIKDVKIVKFYTKQSNTDCSHHTAHQRGVNFLLPNSEINTVNGWIRGSIILGRFHPFYRLRRPLGRVEV
jgi:hypothetical protein